MLWQTSSIVEDSEIRNNRASDFLNGGSGRGGGIYLGDVEAEEVRTLFADHDCSGVGVGTHQSRHDRRIDHAHAIDATHAQSGVDDGVSPGTHATAADAVVTNTCVLCAAPGE